MLSPKNKGRCSATAALAGCDRSGMKVPAPVTTSFDGERCSCSNTCEHRNDPGRPGAGYGRSRAARRTIQGGAPVDIVCRQTRAECLKWYGARIKFGTYTTGLGAAASRERARRFTVVSLFNRMQLN